MYPQKEFPYLVLGLSWDKSSWRKMPSDYHFNFWRDKVKLLESCAFKIPFHGMSIPLQDVSINWEQTTECGVGLREDHYKQKENKALVAR